MATAGAAPGGECKHLTVLALQLSDKPCGSNWTKI